MNDMTPALLSIQIGAIAPLGPKRVPSAFIKSLVTGPVRIFRLGLEGDQQADKRVHGGPEKAVYAYPAASYAQWRADFPQHDHRLTPGAFGENLTIEGLTEADLCAGDIHEIGTARLQVCDARLPCFKFALRFEDSHMPRAMLKSGRSGWYYRVLDEGVIRAGDRIDLVERPNPNLSFARLVDMVFHGETSQPELALVAEATGLATWLTEAARSGRLKAASA